MSNTEFNLELSALGQADQDMQKENREALVNKQIDQEKWIEQQAIIGRLFKAGMGEIVDKIHDEIK